MPESQQCCLCLGHWMTVRLIMNVIWCLWLIMPKRAKSERVAFSRCSQLVCCDVGVTNTGDYLESFFLKHYTSLSTQEVPKGHLRNTQVQSCDNVCFFVAMVTFPKWWPVLCHMLHCQQFLKTLVFVIKGMFQPMQQ